MYCRCVEKKTFNPNKNYFETEKIVLKRPETEVEIDLNHKIEKHSTAGIITITVGVLLAVACAITFGVLAEAVHVAFAACAFGGVLLFFIGGIVLARSYFWELAHRYGEELCTYHKEHDKELWANYEVEVETYNEEQKKIAEAWRSEHILEEKIRACFKDPRSSVELADLVRYLYKRMEEITGMIILRIKEAK